MSAFMFYLKHWSIPKSTKNKKIYVILTQIYVFLTLNLTLFYVVWS